MESLVDELVEVCCKVVVVVTGLAVSVIDFLPRILNVAILVDVLVVDVLLILVVGEVVVVVNTIVDLVGELLLLLLAYEGTRDAV